MRDGLHSGAEACALVNSIPRSANRVDAGRPGLGMPAEHADPVIQVVYRDKENVRRTVTANGRRNCAQHKQRQRQDRQSGQ